MEKKKIILKPKENVEFFMTKLLEAELKYGGEFLQWVMDNMKWLLKEYAKSKSRKLEKIFGVG